jgi:hypothetical protein
MSKTKSIGAHVKAAKRRATKAAAKPPPKPSAIATAPKVKGGKDALIERLQRQVRAYQERERKERKLAGDVQNAEAELEVANANRAAAKQRLAEANKKLAICVNGETPRDVEKGTQQKIIEEKPKGKVEPLIDPRRDGREACSAGKLLTANPWKEGDDGQPKWIAGFLDERWKKAERRKAIDYGITYSALLDSLIAPEGLPPGEKAPKVKAITATGYSWLVVDGWRGTELEDASFALVQLLKKDDWRDVHQDTYGPAVPGFDANDEAKSKRIAGGPDCGRIVHVAGVKGDFVVGPRDAAWVLTVPAKLANDKEPEEIKLASVDTKAKAANDSTNDDDESDGE